LIFASTQDRQAGRVVILDTITLTARVALADEVIE